MDFGFHAPTMYASCMASEGLVSAGGQYDHYFLQNRRYKLFAT
jgi:hypothetical protein